MLQRLESLDAMESRQRRCRVEGRGDCPLEERQLAGWERLGLKLGAGQGFAIDSAPLVSLAVTWFII